jgi:hypothetical protein
MNGKVESCSNDQDESDVNQHPKDHCQANPAATEFTAAIGAGSNAAEAAKSLILFLTGPAAAPVFKSKGLQPG